MVAAKSGWMEPKARQPRGQTWLARRFDGRQLRPRYAAYLIIGFWSFAIVVFAFVERLVDPRTFHTFWLGIWWAVQTVTTVGYGDVVPGSTAGKVIASFLMLGGLSLLSVVTATITSGFVTRAQARYREEHGDPVLERLERMSTQIEALQAELERRPGR